MEKFWTVQRDWRAAYPNHNSICDPNHHGYPNCQRYGDDHSHPYFDSNADDHPHASANAYPHHHAYPDDYPDADNYPNAQTNGYALAINDTESVGTNPTLVKC